MKRAIVWFKTDLRIQDNEVLVRAIEQSEQIVPVYCFDETHFKWSTFGFKKTGAFRAQFLLESLQNLDLHLRALGSGLLIIKGKPEIELPKLVNSYQAQKVFAKKEVAYEEIQTQLKVEQALWLKNVTLETYSTSTLYHAKDLPFALKDIPEIFTQFRKKVEIESQINAPFETPKKIVSPAIPKLELPSLLDLGLSKPKLDTRAVLDFKGGADEAWHRLKHYFFDTQLLSQYKEIRNGMIGESYSTKFSAWLAMGCISARSIYAQVKEYEKLHGANDSTYWLIFELLWRDYFRFMMKKHHQKIFLPQGIKGVKKSANPFNAELFEQWKNGTTGNDFIDANMLELKLTGFMSNRGRQNVASFFIHQLKMDWRYGAAYFEEQLIDYDVCSNWGNWLYLAGVGNDPRASRVFNIEKQASEYDKQGHYRALWLNN